MERMIIMKKTCFIFLGCLFLITACDGNSNGGSNVTSSPSPSPKSLAKGQIHEHCVRSGNIADGSTDLSYEIYYTGEVLNRIESTESVISSSPDVLDTYEEAYRTVHSYYKNVDYYYTEVVRQDNRVTSIIRIDYDHVDADTLLALEGENDNVYENKIAKISRFKDLAKKVGMTCTEVS